MDRGQQPIQFEVLGAGSEDPLGLWTVRPAGPVHFGMGDESTVPQMNSPVYRIQLLEDRSAAEAAFRDHENRMQQSAITLESIPGRLERLGTQTAAQKTSSGSGPVHFGSDGSSLNLEGPEAELFDMLTLVDTGMAASTPDDAAPVDFGVVNDVVLPGIEQARAQLQALLDQVNQEVLHFAWIETLLSGQLLARTSVDWTGRTGTIWMDGISTSDISLHARSLRFAIGSRALKLRMAMTVLAGATKLSALMVNPAGAVLALPLVYRYVNQILSQASEMRSLYASYPPLKEKNHGDIK